MTPTEFKKKIIELKKEKNAVILAHYYVDKDIQEIADEVGDSFYLSKTAKNCKENTIVFCGVNFMAESAKILSPEKKVLIPVNNAFCPMANMVDEEGILSMKEKHPDAKVVCYVNSTAEVKAVSDICCTSSNAVKIVNNLDADKIIFVPDKNLGSYVAEQVKDKEIILWDGYCWVHDEVTEERLLKVQAESLKNDEKVATLVHPECRKNIRDKADFVGSTGQIIAFAGKADYDKYIIVTEGGIKHKLTEKYPEKEFIFVPLMHCFTMKKIILENLYECLNEEKFEVNLDEKVINKASHSLQNMLKLGK
ncbi:quinolinate synthase NadA [Clostridium sediminicola]|uniref:quinolinate synthase NadA n=1 Tax=Clostridium sediminicola TaxID=3114879 RepID=UPI0031F25398